jgi:tRNA(Arg) A34 adenosine deaminase TadA
MSIETSVTTDDLEHLRRTIRLAEACKIAGEHPFASIVVDENGGIVVEAGNQVRPPGDPTGHAELVAAGRAARVRSPAQLAQCTLYTNAEPCCMCAGAIYWCNIRRVVYALSETRLLSLTGNHPENPTLSLPCREVFASGQHPVAVVGPLLEDEAAEAHEGFWR